MSDLEIETETEDVPPYVWAMTIEQVRDGVIAGDGLASRSMDLWACTTCGAGVIEAAEGEEARAVHTAWHERLRMAVGWPS